MAGQRRGTHCVLSVHWVVAMMDDEVVRKRNWLTRGEFLDLLGATNLIPGPNSTEMAIHIGLVRAGWRGLIAAGCCFISPAVLIVLAFAWAYVRFGSLPEVLWLLYGVKPVIIAIVVQALWAFTTKAVKGPLTGAVGIAVIALSFLLRGDSLKSPALPRFTIEVGLL